MKKWLFVLLPLLVLLSGSTCLAYEAPDGNNYTYYQYMGSSWSFYSNKAFCYIINQSNNSNASFPILVIYDDGTNKYLAKLASNAPANSNSIIFSPYDETNHYFNSFTLNDPDDYYVFRTSNSSTYNLLTPRAQIDDSIIFSNYDDALNYLLEQDREIDFSNPIYLPQLANPDVVMKYNSLNIENDYSVPVQAEIIPTTLGDYPIYLRVQCKYYIPSLVQINFKNGISDYAPVTYGSASSFDVYSYDDYYTGNNSDPIVIDFNTANDGIALNNWESDKSSLATTFGGSNSGSTAFNQAVSDYEQYSKNAVTMGNRMECFFTFFTVIDGICYQGLTTRWYSVSPDTFDLQNNAYDVMSVIKSYTGIATNAISALLEGSSQVPPNNPSSLSDDDVLAIAQSMIDNADVFGIVKSENSIYENINNPNGYSTIVAYNHDNIFNMFKDYYREGTGFFTSFPSYLYYYMAWIPREVWNLVAMGFLIALVVMIVKVL